jgi:hypothetical protein
MSNHKWVALTLVMAAALACAVSSTGAPKAPSAPVKPPPKLDAVAETKLLMDGLNQSNFRGMEKLLSQKPDDVETWKFIRGQALLIAETGNLLLLRPPKTAGEEAWMDRATELRDSATALAKVAAERDYDKSRQGLIKLAATCNRCHQTFRVPARVTPFEETPDK